MSNIERSYAAISAPSRAQKQLMSLLRTTCRRISRMLDLPPTAIPLDELVEIDARLIAYIEALGVGHQSAVQYTCELHKLLELAHMAGWTSPAFELRKAWQPIRTALKGDARGSGSIVRLAIRQNCLPQDFTEEVIAAWKQRMLGKGRSLGSIVQMESHFRTMLRRAGLQDLLPKFSLASKNLPRYRLKLEDLPRSLQREIFGAIRWKAADEDLADRDARLMIRPVTGMNLRRSFLELYSYARVIRGIGGITHLSQLITKEIVCGFVDWLLANKRCKPQSVISKMSSICSLSSTYPKLKGVDYSWFRAKLRELRKEAPGKVQRRKLDGLPDYPSVAEIASRILSLRTGPQKLTEIETGWVIHDALTFMINVHTPHRSRNTCEARSHEHQQLNLFITDISAELASQFKLPDWAKKLRSNNPRTKFLVGHWTESATKAGHEVWEVLPHEVRDLFREYMERYRPLLLRQLNPDRADSTLVFFARNGNPLNQKSLLSLVARLSVRFTEKRMKVKDFRDLYAAHMLSAGATVEEIATSLWHIDPFACSTTVRYYTAGFNASHGAVALEDEIAILTQ
jgi:hypothetical protein